MRKVQHLHSFSLEHFVEQGYKKMNNLKGYKIPKLKFANELEVLIIKDIVQRCGGNPSQVDDILKPK
jgi:hypothetical protein